MRAGKILILTAQIGCMVLSLANHGIEGAIYAAAQFICCALFGLALVTGERR